MHSGKVWGVTSLIEANSSLEFHKINIKKGGVCSKHKHKYKWNGFYVDSGKLIIRVWKNDYEKSLCCWQQCKNKLVTKHLSALV